MDLRQSLQPTITELTKATDYWSEQYVRGRASYQEYTRIILIMQDLKNFILEHERNDDETIRVLSRSNGGLHTEADDSVETSSSGTADEERHQYVRSNS